MKPIPTETATDVGSMGKWLGAAAAGALLMYLLDPERGSARRSRAVSALRTAGARTGNTVDHALHSAGDRLADLKDSAAGVLSRGTGRLQAQTAPMLDRARHGVQEATRRLEQRASHAKEHVEEHVKEYGKERHGDDPDTGRSTARYNSYESGSYDADRYGSGRYHETGRERGGLAGWLRGLAGTGRQERSGTPHPALVGGGMLGLLSLMRRKPGGLLVGLAGLALLLQSTRDKTYRVTDNIRDTMLHSKHAGEGSQASRLAQGEQPGSRYLH